MFFAGTLRKLYRKVLFTQGNYSKAHKMAKSTFEYVKNFELDDSLLPNTWIVVRLDGKCFHKFADDHNFVKPNDKRALNLMNYAAFTVFREFHDLMMAFGQSDEYSFVFKKHTTLYKRRAAKLLTTINSKFSSSYVYYWSKFFPEDTLKYPPVFDGRIVLYPSEENLVDYMKWRQADVHINNLYNTVFWALVLKGNLSPTQAEQRLCGTVSADKNEILFKEFNINYNNEPVMFRRGTLLLKKNIANESSGKNQTVIVDVHDDMLKDKFWQQHSSMLLVKPSKQDLVYEGHMTSLISEQINKNGNVDKDYNGVFSCLPSKCDRFNYLLSKKSMRAKNFYYNKSISIFTKNFAISYVQLLQLCHYNYFFRLPTKVRPSLYLPLN